MELGVREKRSCVMKGKENSMPEKNRIKQKCVAFRMRCEFVLRIGAALRFCSVCLAALPLVAGFDAATADGSVSGR